MDKKSRVFWSKFAGVAIVALAGAVASAQVSIQTFVTSIPVTSPDDSGNPVSLDAEVIIPDLPDAVPGVIWNHGFGGHKGNDRSIRERLARNGYVVLSYTSRGFGDTPGQVDLLGPKEQQDLIDAVDWLIDPGNALVAGAVLPDSIGQVGASYGGLHAWALARSGHPAVRTVVPIATATNLYDAMVPYDVTMMVWPVGFYATGFVPEEQNYSNTFHQIVLEMVTGVNMQHVEAELTARSMTGHWDDVNIPVFIIQGINDSLFPANTAMKAFQELTSRGIETRLYLGGIGHPPAVGDGDEIERLFDQVEQWLNRQLKGAPESETPLITTSDIEIANAGYFNSHWDGTVRYADDITTPSRTYYLKATSATGGTLSTTPPLPLLTLPLPMINTYAGSGYLDEPVTSELLLGLGLPLPNLSQIPGVLTFETAPFTSSNAIDVAGIPTFDLKVISIHQLPVGEPGLLAAFQVNPKIWDVDPQGNATLISRGTFSEPVNSAPLVASPLHTTTFENFGMFYTFEAGHRLRITLSTEDTPYLRPTTNPFIVTIHPGSKVTFPTGQWLSAPDQVAVVPDPEPPVPPTIFEGLTSVQELVFDALGL
ncbi:MAG: alpha/beta hydrolase [Candidatus Hydrogenedentes bacterium]|nr:alpha/beta hydrolase [Candidatus Hydrogenedentota bacterium]